MKLQYATVRTENQHGKQITGLIQRHRTLDAAIAKSAENSAWRPARINFSGILEIVVPEAATLAR